MGDCFQSKEQDFEALYDIVRNHFNLGSRPFSLYTTDLEVIVDSDSMLVDTCIVAIASHMLLVSPACYPASSHKIHPFPFPPYVVSIVKSVHSCKKQI